MDNPIGLKAVDHFEFTCDSLTTPTAKTFELLGFVPSEKRGENEVLYTQGQVRFLLKNNSTGKSRDYFNKHGEGVSRVAFTVENAEKAIETAVSRGAKMIEDLKTVETADGVIRTAAIQGFGDVVNEYVERPNSLFRDGFKKTGTTGTPLKTRCSRVDHFTNNVPKGEMDHWVDFYKKIYGFRETRYFDIKGTKTGLLSKVVQSHDNSIIIPINEPEVEGGKSQIQEFLDLHKGAGVQHIALMTPDIIDTIAELRERGIRFLNTPSTYYEGIPNRNFKVTEDLKILEKLQLLVDGDQEGYLLQIFSDNYVGPLFFEFIQRKNHWGFGNGNFQALFDSIELDQIRRGYLKS